VKQILVKEGEQVRKGQVVAVLDNIDTNEANLSKAKAELQVANRNLAKAKAGTGDEVAAQQATIARLEEQLRGEIVAQQATVNRIAAQLKGEIVAQQATVARIQATLRGQQTALAATVARVAAEQRNAQADVQRYETLYSQGAISSQERDKRRLSAETSSEQLNESRANRAQTIATLEQQLAEANANQYKSIATLEQQLAEANANKDKTIGSLQKQIDEEKAKLSRIQEVNPADVEVAQAQVMSAIAAIRQAQASLDLSYVRSTIDGEVLKIHTKPGEKIADKGIAEIGQTQRMRVVAEVPEDGISRVRIGQTAKVISNNGAFDSEIQGTVAEIGRQVGKQDVLNTDPAADVDARVVEVKIDLRPQDMNKVAGLTNAKVQVRIDI
jgi:HlyD family secretion protein